VVDLLTYSSEETHEQAEDFLNSGHLAGRLYGKFSLKHCQQAVIGDEFAGAMYPEQFCTTYHNHGEDEPCYAWSPPSILAKNLCDDTNNAHLLQPVEIEGIPYCRIANSTGIPFDIAHHQGQRPDIDWKRVRSFCSRIFFPHEGPQRREIEPVMIDDDEFDENGRRPSHPGYKDGTWTLRRATTKGSNKDELEIIDGIDDEEEDDLEEYYGAEEGDGSEDEDFDDDDDEDDDENNDEDGVQRVRWRSHDGSEYIGWVDPLDRRE
jgi:hypothetical protein